MKYLYMMFLFFSVLSCNQDIENITIKGVVRNAKTKEFMSNVEVVVICWKYGDTPDGSYTEEEKIIIKTNNKGEYRFSFDKGAFVEVRVFANGYIDGYETKEIYKKINSIDIYLIQ